MKDQFKEVAQRIKDPEMDSRFLGNGILMGAKSTSIVVQVSNACLPPGYLVPDTGGRWWTQSVPVCIHTQSMGTREQLC